MADENNGGDFLVNTAKFLGKVTLAVAATAVFADDIGGAIEKVGAGAGGFWESLTGTFGELLRGASGLAASGLQLVVNGMTGHNFAPADFQSIGKDVGLGLSGVGGQLWSDVTKSASYEFVTNHPYQTAGIAVGGGAVAEVVGRWTQKVAHDNAVNVNINPAYKS